MLVIKTYDIKNQYYNLKQNIEKLETLCDTFIFREIFYNSKNITFNIRTN
jgi:hypothetical protein